MKAIFKEERTFTKKLFEFIKENEVEMYPKIIDNILITQEEYDLLKKEYPCFVKPDENGYIGKFMGYDIFVEKKRLIIPEEVFLYSPNAFDPADIWLTYCKFKDIKRMFDDDYVIFETLGGNLIYALYSGLSEIEPGKFLSLYTIFPD